MLFETKPDSALWGYSVYVESAEADQWTAVIRDRLGHDCFGLEIEREDLVDKDWVSETLRELSPVSAGRFFVHGSHDRAAATGKRVAVEVDAGQAFGTGHHGTTAGCLDMLEVCLRESSGQLGLPRRALDVGTGSGVLAIALAKVCHIPVLATDIDPVAVAVARENCRLNGVGSPRAMRHCRWVSPSPIYRIRRCRSGICQHSGPAAGGFGPPNGSACRAGGANHPVRAVAPSKGQNYRGLWPAQYGAAALAHS